MKNRISPLLALLLLLLFSGSCLAAKRTVYTFGVVPQFDARHLHAIWRPILDEISKITNLDFQLVGSPTIPSFEKEFNQGKFDFAYMNPFHSILARRQQGYVPLVRDQANPLVGVIVVRKDSRITDVAQLDNKLVAFPAPNALGATLIPLAELQDKYAIHLIPKYVQTHTSVYLNVALNQVEAGGGVLRTLQKQPAAVQDNLRVLYQTQAVAPHPVVAHPRVSEAHKEKVKQAFLMLGRSEAGQQLLANIPIGHIGPASLDDYLPLSKLRVERFYSRGDN